MSLENANLSELKRKIRKLKRFETIIRFNGKAGTDVLLIWNHFFDLHDKPMCKAKYTLNILAAMNREEYRKVIDEYFALVYYEIYREKGIVTEKVYDPSILENLNLSFDVGEKDIKKRFRELAKEYHPDTGGDVTKFIELMKIYERLIGR